MRVCSECERRLADPCSPEDTRPFPAATVAAGALGTLAAMSTGALLLVPAALVLGAVADAQRCQVCGAQIAEENPGHRLMEELDDGAGGLAYRPAVGSQGAGRPQGGSGAGAPRSASESSLQEEELGEPVLPATPDESDDHLNEQLFVFDEVEGALIPREQALFGPELGLDLPSPDGAEQSQETLFDEPPVQDQDPSVPDACLGSQPGLSFEEDAFGPLESNPPEGGVAP